jgi:hypothetical protein
LAHGADTLRAPDDADSAANWCEHLFVTSQGSPYARFRRALDSRNVTVAYATATELNFVSLPDALELVLLVVDDPRRFRRAALRWHARFCAELPDVGFEEAHAVLACLAGLTGRRPKAAAGALAELVHRRGLERASEALTRWGARYRTATCERLRVEGDVIVRTHEIARWRETGDLAYEREFAMRLTLDDERIVRIVAMPGGH